MCDEELSEDEEFSAQFEAHQTEEVDILDKYPSDSEDNEEESDCEMDDEALETSGKPCYFPSQIEMAAILKKRIDTIMEHYHNIAKLSDEFDDVDFVVYTARYRMLSDQTEKRIRHPHAGVLPRRERDPKDGSCKEKKTSMYILSADTEKNHEDLKKRISENSRTLFIIIADECHWGITKGTDQTPSAHNLFINEWCNDNPPRNAIVVQISATPFNLLTRNSRLPAVKCALVNQTTSKHQAGDLMVLKNETGLPEQEPENSKRMELHVAHWSEVELKNFETGMRMKLKSALQDKDSQSQYLSVSANGKLHVTSSESEANEFIVHGSQGIVTVRVLAKKEGEETEMLTITRNDDGTLKASAEPKFEPATFEVKLEFGVGIVAFCWTQKRDHYIGVSKSGDVTCGVSIMKPKEDLGVVSFEFYISSSAPLAVKEAGHQYLSLNYYLGTVNCCYKQEKKIRKDAFFQDIVDKAKRQGKMSKTFPVDALLCADYCYNILHRSVYKDEEKIRLRLVSGSENDEFEGKLSSFLAQESKEPERYFPREAFEFVQKELCNKVTEDYNEALKHFQDRKHKSTSGISKNSKKELTASYVACLMHLPNKDLREVHNKTPTNIMKELQSNDLQTLLNIWADIVGEGETSSMVTDLISSGTTREGEMERGKMKILRAKSMETANKFFYTLRLARKVSGLADSFEVIRDYGSMQIETQMMKASSSFFQKLQTDNCSFGCGCKSLERRPKCKECGSCQHVHKPITQYEDLENLACVLILVDKGRMGDTFPQSFNCLDLRLSYDSNKEFKEGSAIFLSSLIQELGRMCRYVKMSVNDSFVDNIPCALVGRALFKALEVSLRRSPAVSAISCTKPDRYMTRVKKGKRPEYCSRWLNYEASKDSFDHGNEETYCNRILLQAEPQIGKTGTYLCLIKQLRDDILQTQEPSDTSVDKLGEGSFYFYKESDSSPDKFDDEEQDWQFPFWKTVQDSPSLLKRPVGPGKYSIAGHFYTHDAEDNPFILMEESGQKTARSSFHRQVDVKEDIKQVLRAWHWHHFENCAECGRLLQGKEPDVKSIEVDISGTHVSVKCSFPTGCGVYGELRKELKNFKPSEDDWGKLDNLTGDGDPCNLSYWIFHPSHRGDPRKCTLNYHHVMQENDQVKNHIQAVVVRSEKFEDYKSTWGKVLLILELPEGLPDCEVGPSEGGVGYTRLFIQKMAFALRLEYIFVIDDNVAMMSEAVFSRDEQSTSHGTVVRDAKNIITMERCSFLTPLSHLRRLVQGKEVPPRDKEQYEPWEVEPDARQYPLYSYTGPAKLFGDKVHESYGVLGFLRSVPNVVRPFAKTQVYAAILLNVKSTVEKSVFYRPWPCWEDLRFNDDCDKAGLWVVKFNRYHFLKLQFKGWINDLVVPGIFEWKEDTTLEERPPTTELPKDLEERIVLQCIDSLKTSDHVIRFKGRVGCCENDGDAISLEEMLEKVKASEYNDDASPDEVQVLVLSYALKDVEIKDLTLLDSLYCKTKIEKIVFVISADEAKKKWPSLNLEMIKSDYGLCFTRSMRKRKATFAMFSAADPRRHKVRLILIEVSFQDGNRAEEEHGKSFEERGTSAAGVRDTNEEWMKPSRASQESPSSELGQGAQAANKPIAAGLVEEVVIKPSLIGTDVGYGVTEWSFAKKVSQSTIDGRNGSNACTIIALRFGSIYQQSNLTTPVEDHLNGEWQTALIDAIRTGNGQHDNLFDGQGINLAVDDAIDIVGDHYHVHGILQEHNVFDANPLDQFAAVIDSILLLHGSFHVLTVNNMTLSIIVDANGTLMLIDSHIHGKNSALIARSVPHHGQHAQQFSAWFNAMLIRSCGVGLSTCSLATISYS